MSGRSSGSESDGSIEYGIAAPGGSGLNIPASIQAAAAKLAPAGAAAPGAPVHTIVQFDQKKTPAFYGLKNIDALTLNEWIRRIDGMRKSLGWNAETTFHNARAALFADAANHIDCNHSFNALIFQGANIGSVINHVRWDGVATAMAS